MLQQGREVRYRTVYILGSDHRIFWEVAIGDPGKNSDYLMVMGCLCGTSPRDNLRYLRQRTRLLIRLTGCQKRTWVDKIFVKLQRAVTNPDKRAVRPNSWILEETWRIIDERVSVRWGPRRCQMRVRYLGRAIWAALKGEMRRRVETAGNNVERILNSDPPLPSPANHVGGCRDDTDQRWMITRGFPIGKIVVISFLVEKHY